MRAPELLVRPSVVDLVSLSAVAVGLSALVAAWEGKPALALGLLPLALLLDMADGALARRLDRATPFGRELDSLCDVVIYLVGPVAALHAAGLGPGWTVATGLPLLAAGLLRLSHFNAAGFTTGSDGELAYRGMPVFWTHAWAVVAGPLVWTDGRVAPFAALVAWCMAGLMVIDRPFPKPRPSAALVALILAVAAGFLSMGTWAE